MLLTNTLRKLAPPDPGCYLYEAEVNEPDLSQAYWVDFYARTLSIKRRYDPYRVFGGALCAGGEDCKLEGEQLCHTWVYSPIS